MRGDKKRRARDVTSSLSLFFAITNSFLVIFVRVAAAAVAASPLFSKHDKKMQKKVENVSRYAKNYCRAVFIAACQTQFAFSSVTMLIIPVFILFQVCDILILFAFWSAESRKTVGANCRSSFSNIFFNIVYIVASEIYMFELDETRIVGSINNN